LPTDKRHIKVPQERLLSPYTSTTRKNNRFSKIFFFSVLKDQTSVEALQGTINSYQLTFVPVLRNRLRDIYITWWRASIDAHTSLYLYQESKSIFQISPYVTLLQNIKYRNILAKLGLSSHNLLIESGRHYQIPRHDR